VTFDGHIGRLKKGGFYEILDPSFTGRWRITALQVDGERKILLVGHVPSSSQENYFGVRRCIPQ